MIPILIIVMIAACPIFFDIKSIGQFTAILPLTLYINAAYSNRYFVYMLAYAVIFVLLCVLADKLSRIKINKLK